MTQIGSIQAKVAANEFEFSRHAVDQSLRRRISVQEVREAVVVGQIIEDYPDDKYGPSCLLLGYTQKARPLHIHCSYASRPLVKVITVYEKVITVYEPDPDQWADLRTRKQEDGAS
jgi:hypothetical protein